MSEIDEIIDTVANMYRPTAFDSLDHFIKTIKRQSKMLVAYKLDDLFTNEVEDVAKLREYIENKVDQMKDKIEKKYYEEDGK